LFITLYNVNEAVMVLPIVCLYNELANATRFFLLTLNRSILNMNEYKNNV